MLIKRVEAKNVYSFDNVQIPFENGVLQITGTNTDECRNTDDGSVNGIGKTNIYNLITQALYSKDVYKTKKDYLKNLFSSNAFEIKLWTDKYYVEYTKDETKLYGKDELILTGRKAVTEFFENLIPFDLFLPLTYISSSVYFPFFDATPNQQKEFISLVFSDLLKLQEAIPKLKTEKAELLKRLNAIEAKIEVYKVTSEEEVMEGKYDIPELPILKEYTSKIKELRDKINNIKDLAIEKSELEKIEKIEELENKSEELSKEKDRKVRGNTLIQVAEKEYKDLTKLADYSTCPTCSQKIQYDPTQAEECKADLDGMKATMITVKNNITKLETHQTLYMQSVSKKEIYNKAQERLEEMGEIAEVVPLIDEIEKLRSLDNAQTEKYNLVKDERDSLIEKQGQLNAARTQKANAQMELTQHEKRRENIKEELNKLELLIQICDKVILEKQLPERLNILEIFINTELSTFTSQYKVKLEMQKAKIIPKVLKDGKDYPFQNCSQGEKGRINLALVLAIRNILKKLHKEVPEFLFVDELLNIIDTGGKHLIIESLQELKAVVCVVCHDYTFDTEQLFLVKGGNKTWVKAKP